MTTADIGLFAMILGLLNWSPWRDTDKDSGLRLLLRVSGVGIFFVGELVFLAAGIKRA